eukprot:1089897-Pyramimonas_sp.AAC.1
MRFPMITRTFSTHKSLTVHERQYATQSHQRHDWVLSEDRFVQGLMRKKDAAAGPGPGPGLEGCQSAG